MCGGTLEFNPGDTVAVCDSCGTKQTLPKLDDERRANLYDRANHFRRNNDYDKAMSMYEQILSEDKTDAEAYWSLVLCRYGIEYVEDPTTHKRVPTVNRAQFTSIFDDDNYKSALEYADSAQREVYEEEANAINEIQKGILAISQKEDPFDIFICYKETDNSGRRTPDSVLATDLYHQLTQEGFKVFFSRITLEDKLGIDYEPYIFAALNSAKIMVVLGTKPEYFNAVWVKNEWSRYLALIKNGAKKVLIPAYRDMDPYDLPDEFSHLQALDMSKLGFMQDLIRGIKKIIADTEPKTVIHEKVIENTPISNAAPLLERAYLFLEDGNWKEADEYCEKVLDIEPKNAMAYLGKLMADEHAKTKEALKNSPYKFDNNDNYRKAIRFGNDELKAELEGYTDFIVNRNLENAYNAAVKSMNDANNEDSYKKAASKFESILNYKDSEQLKIKCLDLAENSRKEAIYVPAVNLMENAKTEESYKAAASKFESIINYRDSEQLKIKCLDLAENCRKEVIYEAATIDMNTGNHKEAISKFESIIDYKDSAALIEHCKNRIATLEAERLRKEKEAKEKADKEAKAKADKEAKAIKITIPIVIVCIAILIPVVNVVIPSQKYNKAMAFIEAGNYTSAYEILTDLNYKDSDLKAESIHFEYELEQLKNASVGDNIILGTYEQDNDLSDEKEKIEWQVLAKEKNKILIISKYALDCQPYNSVDIETEWENCSLRKWLNNEFLNDAFNTDEQSIINLSTISNYRNIEDTIYPKNNTDDKIFLLSTDEVNQYFNSDEGRLCIPTKYAEKNGATINSSFTIDSNYICCWWLRTTGTNSNTATIVNFVGTITNDSFLEVNEDIYCVRPAMWISLED